MAIRKVGERIKRKKLPEGVAQGVREQTDFEKFKAEQEPVKEVIEPERQKGILRRTAEFGLLPASFAARQINKVFGEKFTGGRDLSTSEIASLTADSPVGYGLGLGTAAAEAYLGARIGARFLPKGVTSKIPSIKGRGLRGVFSKKTIPHISEEAIRAHASKAGLTRAGVAQVRRQLGKMRVAQVAENLKNTQGSLLSRFARGAFSTKRLGTGILLGWLGADTIAQSTGFQASKVEGNVIFGQMSKSEALSELDTLQTYNNMGKGAVLAAAAISPAAIPFLIFGWQSTSLANNQIERSRRVVEGL